MSFNTDQGFGTANAIEMVMGFIERYTCIRFSRTPIEHDKHHIKFTPGPMRYSVYTIHVHTGLYKFDSFRKYALIFDKKSNVEMLCAVSQSQWFSCPLTYKYIRTLYIGIV